jgi:hypothetical protein
MCCLPLPIIFIEDGVSIRLDGRDIIAGSTAVFPISRLSRLYSRSLHSTLWLPPVIETFVDEFVFRLNGIRRLALLKLLERDHRSLHNSRRVLQITFVPAKLRISYTDNIGANRIYAAVIRKFPIVLFRMFPF